MSRGLRICPCFCLRRYPERFESRNSRSGTHSTYPSSIEFYYHCRIPSSDASLNKTGSPVSSPSILLRCNPVWHGQSATKLGKQWFDWVEVNWTNDDGSVFTVPAQLALWGKVSYADGSNELLAVVQSLKCEGIMLPHDRMFFSRVDTWILHMMVSVWSNSNPFYLQHLLSLLSHPLLKGKFPNGLTSLIP